MAYIKPLLPFLLCLALLLLSNTLTTLAWVNAAAQCVLFAFVVLLPTWKTGRMSYVDIGWPLGLAVIGIVTITIGWATDGGVTMRDVIISIVMLFIGLRMGLGAIWLWRKGHLNKELPRYQYQHVRWKRRGIKNIPLIQQSEALAQGAANMSFLALPAFMISINPATAVHWLEIVGLIVWVAAYAMETLADVQKTAFLLDMREKKLSKQVCNVGLWRYSRHPNYFAEWMVWNALIIGAIPSWIALFDKECLVVWLLLGLCTLLISRIMYTTLVTYTGARPAEYYSVQKRPGYRQYQAQTNRFFPGPVSKTKQAD